MVGPRTCCSLCCNLFSTSGDELADRTPTNGSYTSTPTPAASWAQIPTSAPAPTISSIDKLCQ